MNEFIYYLIAGVVFLSLVAFITPPKKELTVKQYWGIIVSVLIWPILVPIVCVEYSIALRSFVFPKKRLVKKE